MTFYLGAPICLADLVTRPENSLIHQSVKAKERLEPLNGDGFGVAWYVKGLSQAARFRSLTPAWSNANLDELARVTQSHCLLAHVRAATDGTFDVAEANCHPFRKGRYAFMHNGHIEQFPKLRRALMARLSHPAFNSIRGNTDSEHLFALVSDFLPPEASGHVDDLIRALRLGIATLHELIDQHAPNARVFLNVILTDGHCAAVCRYSSDPTRIDSLYINRGERYGCHEQRCWMDSGENDAVKAVLVSSEPLNSGPNWQPVPPNHLLGIDSDLRVCSQIIEQPRIDRPADSVEGNEP
ncbi:class II glutamine amidotransferase [Wenzhouxiangella limi]|uniref:Class II glutamine amidotransferase n=1 Tax=Wenzhouxiangella limi TaxID=2707351 RepID=A0A845UZ32_9GAMM|nr:class II glutamine amidotransferase [Wenzhouxiangella limi]NDY96657.1 class II glutamine amidotransferase [Wenzhouxiangella limi]